MDIPTFLHLMLRNWWLILLSILVTAGTAAYAVSQQEPVYSATAQVELRPNIQIEETRDVVNVMVALDKRTIINTMARKATGNAMQGQVAQVLGVSPLVIAESDLTALVLPDTNLIDIQAMSTNPEFAAAIVNTVAEELSKELPEKALQLDITNRASPPITPAAPQPIRTITLGVLFGLLIGMIMPLVNYALSTTFATRRVVRSSEDETPVVGELPAPIDTATSAQTQRFYT